MTKEITKTGANLPQNMTAQDLMDEFGVSSTDIVLPRLLLMQSTSEFVGEGQAKLGDLVNSQTKEVIGGITQSIDIIPLKKIEKIFVYDATSQPQKFLKVIDATPKNLALPYEDVEDGMMVKRFRAFTFRILLRGDMAANVAYPYEFRLTRW